MHFGLMQGRNRVTLACMPNRREEASIEHLTIHQVLQFDSQTHKSGVVVTSDSAASGSAFLFIKGAPRAIRDTVDPASVPTNFDQARQHLTAYLPWTSWDCATARQLLQQ